jgi:mannosyltransferase OCH1-like enzyme
MSRTKRIALAVFGSYALTAVFACFQLLSVLIADQVISPSLIGENPFDAIIIRDTLGMPLFSNHSLVGNEVIVGPIPHIMWFTYKHNILKTKEPQHYYENVLKTIHAYQTEWNDTNARVFFLTDDDCMSLMRRVDKRERTRLATAFSREEKGPLKSDLCRLAALYLHGGYYFDVDLEVVKPVRMDPSVSFSTVDSQLAFFFQAFLAASPGHPVLKTNLQMMMKAYFTEQETCWDRDRDILGPCTLTKAWEQTNHNGTSRFLEEINLQKHEGLYPNITQRGIGEHCHWVVHDRDKHEVYFYSRIVGVNICEAEEAHNKTLVNLGV